jgi:hypothetical protein
VQILDVAVGPGRLIERFGSRGASHLGGAAFDGAGGVAFLTLTPGGHLGRHPTVLAQLFCVVTGSGWVAGDDGRRHALAVGQAALWEPGEEHESGSDEGMTVVVLEAGTIHIGPPTPRG